MDMERLNDWLADLDDIRDNLACFIRGLSDHPWSGASKDGGSLTQPDRDLAGAMRYLLHDVANLLRRTQEVRQKVADRIRTEDDIINHNDVAGVCESVEYYRRRLYSEVISAGLFEDVQNEETTDAGAGSEAGSVPGSPDEST